MRSSATSRGAPPTAGRRVELAAEREQTGLVAERAGDRRHEVLDVAERQDRGRLGDVQRLDDRREAGAERVHDDRVLLAVLLAREQRGRDRASSSGSAPRGADPAIATVSNERPTVRTSRSGVAPRNVVPPRVNAKVVLSGARRREVPQRGDDVEIGRRLEHHPPGQDDLVDPAAPDRAGEQADRPLPAGSIGPLGDDLEGAGRDAGPPWVGVAGAARAAVARPSAVPPALDVVRIGVARRDPGAMATVRLVVPPRAGDAERRQDERRGPNGAHGSSAPATGR